MGSSVIVLPKLNCGRPPVVLLRLSPASNENRVVGVPPGVVVPSTSVGGCCCFTGVVTAAAAVDADVGDAPNVNPIFCMPASLTPVCWLLEAGEVAPKLKVGAFATLNPPVDGCGEHK